MSPAPPLTGSSPYRRLLRLPHVARLLSVGSIARLPLAMELIAVVLFAREQTGSYAIAGAVAATFGVACGLCSPLLARYVDRLGPRRVLPPAVWIHAAGVLALVGAGVLDLPALVFVLLGFLVGGSYPPTNSVVRRLLGRLSSSSPDLAPAAFAVEAAGVEMAFIAGPLLTSLLVALHSASTALLVAAFLAVVSVLGLERSATALGWKSEVGLEDPHWLNALRSPGLRAIVACMIPLGAMWGAIPVSLTAFASDVASPASAGLLVGMLSLGGAIGAILYGTQAHRFTARTQTVAYSLVIPLLVAPLLLPRSLAAMGVLLVVSGITVTPLLSITNQIISVVAMPGTEAEAFAWPYSSTLVGMAIGAAVAGPVVERWGWEAGIATSLVSGVCVAAVNLLNRRSFPDALLSRMAVTPGPTETIPEPDPAIILRSDRPSSG